MNSSYHDEYDYDELLQKQVASRLREILFNNIEITRNEYIGIYGYCNKLGSSQPPPSASQTDLSSGNFILNMILDIFTEFLDNLLAQKAVIPDDGPELLRFYRDQWVNFQLRYHSFINLSKTRGQALNNPSFNIDSKFTALWKTHFLEKISNSFKNSLFLLINQERCGMKIERDLIHDSLNSLVRIESDLVKGHKETQPYQRISNQYSSHTPTMNFNTYPNFFESDFLEESYAFFESKKENYQSDIKSYIIMTEKLIEREEERASSLFFEKTLEKLQNLLKSILITDSMSSLCDEFKKLLEQPIVETESLGLIHRLVRRVDPELKELSKTFLEHVYNVGFSSIKQLLDQKGGKLFTEPKQYIEPIMDVYVKYNSICVNIFSNDIYLTRAFETACKRFINVNPISQIKGSTGTSPILLACYIDYLFRSTKLDEDEVKTKIDLSVEIFKLLEDCDVFIKHYWKLLAQRLVSGDLKINVYEEQVIADIRSIRGNELTHNIGTLFTDIALSDDILQGYYEHIRNFSKKQSLATFRVKLLATNAWPCSEQPKMDFLVPDVLKSSIDSYENFYMKRHPGRKISWIFGRSRGEIIYLGPNQTKYTISASTYEMAVLLLYNDNTNKLSFNQIQKLTKIPRAELDPVMKILCFNKHPLLKFAKGKESYFFINPQFKNKILRFVLVPLHGIRQKNRQKEANATNDSVREDRKHVIQAAIVRIMKTSKVLSHNILVAEVTKSVLSYFTPTISLIKTQIEKMIETAYIERLGTDKYQYLP